MITLRIAFSHLLFVLILISSVSLHAQDANFEQADILQGRLLLVHGEMDNNVHPANTYRMADALVKAGKRFDMMIFPGARHGFGRYGDYFERMLWDYFAEHLLDYEIDDVDYHIPDHVD